MDPDKWYVRLGMEDGLYSSTIIYCKLTNKRVALLRIKLKENVGWRYTNTCAAWASETVTDITGEYIDANDTMGFETPRKLSESIKALEEKEPTRYVGPKNIPDPKGSSSSK